VGNRGRKASLAHIKKTGKENNEGEKRVQGGGGLFLAHVIEEFFTENGGTKERRTYH